MTAIEGGEVREAREGDTGMRDGSAAMGVGRLEVGEEADGWATSARERRREEGSGRWWACVGRKQGWAAGDWVGFAVFFSFSFFPFLFQIHF
jgi:hypothetical protein